ncbi:MULTISPECIES: MFS transporter [unclassified Caballeronia]|uniref:MFS transporter n=1 Tax=unclassified Caballeronia TaxID=2646786 RepID=UPI0028595CD5|nr:MULTISPECIES: MFS transporter [unclassified Caballeronia]MDR5753293.1 MFS transporter [Caballeronia sp. LZ024]MDR5841032.1 MFS transporter [Caballeronia sp. LZ031]
MSTVLPAAGTAADREHELLKTLSGRRAIVVSTIGNALEWFDFMVYGFFAVIISKLYFPATSPTISLLATWATFGVGFMTRPLGGIVLGAVADRVGRKSALTLTISLMAVGLAFIAFAPTYASIGIAAPILMLIGRLIQGFSAGGEVGCATAFLVEYAPANRRGYFGSYQMVAQAVASLCGSLFGAVLTRSLSPEHLSSWGWRIPFVIGLMIVPVGLYLRSKLDESPVFVEKSEKNELTSTPIRDTATKHWMQVAAGFGLTVFGTIGTYIFLLYLPTHATRVLHMPLTDGLVSSTVGALVYLVCCPVFGTLSDRIGRKKLMLTALILSIITAYPIFAVLTAHPSLPMLIACQALLMLYLGIFQGCYPAFIAELLPSSVRSTGISVSYNVAVMIFGGFAPAIVQWLTMTTGDALSICYYVIFGSAVALFTLLPLRDRYSEALR